ncbi:hypothetical protein V5O48_011761 [Marasmius crinis-equi]|uniref:Uncharacterized protein n=1 Tax=Marasmius crinis-equi TaxID=585013 RepID=A0ABR3F4R4_9AGAR
MPTFKKKNHCSKQPKSISTKVFNPVTSLLAQIEAKPQQLDALLTPQFLLTRSTYTAGVPWQRKSLAKLLHDAVDECVTLYVTPELRWEGDPTRPKSYYRRCFCASLLIGRAFAKLLLFAEHGGEDPDSSSISLEDRKYARGVAEEVWKTCIADVINKALWSGPEVEPGSRVALGIILLASSYAMSTHPHLCKAKGKGWTWGGGFSEPDAAWGWDDIKTAIRTTKDLPSDSFDVGELRGRMDVWYKEIVRTMKVRDEEKKAVYVPYDEVPIYVPREVLVVLDFARAHVLNGVEDMNSQEIVKAVYDGLIKD